MRFSCVTWGSEGDTRPLGALCRGLVDRGHEVRLFADEATLTLPRMLEVPCEPLAGDITSVAPAGDLTRELRLSDMMATALQLKRFVTHHTAAWLRAVGEHARCSDAILFCGLGLTLGRVLAEELNKPAVFLCLQPIWPTREFCAPPLRPITLPGWLNRWTHRVALWSLAAKISPGRARREVFGRPGAKRSVRDFPMLCGVSQELVAQPADWPADHLICGHWSIPSIPVSRWQPPPDLQDFLTGEPPIYAGFGSAAAFLRGKAFKRLIDALAGRRVVFCRGWSRIEGSMLPQNFFVAKDVPHEWLFPRVSLVIHHGGAGTTHTAARAGVPQVILPFGVDQFFWGSRVAARGAGARFCGWNTPAIAQMIGFAERDSTRQKARALGEAMAREDGVGVAVSTLEALVGSAG